MPNIDDYPWVLDDDGNLSAILDQAYDVIVGQQMITDTNGQEILNFNLPLDDPKAEQVGNEDILQVGDSEFVIRTVTDGWDDNGEQCFQVYAEARWYELAEYDPIQPFSFTNVGPDMVMEQFLSTTDWTMGTIDITTTSDFSITELTNSLAGIRMLPTIYGGELYFDNINKKVHLLQRIGMDTDLLYAYGKNLKNNQRVIDTRYLVTRFRPIGKDGLTIADVNNGLDYLENYQWFDAIGRKRKVKCDSISNDNITDPAALKEWGQSIVDANSIPRITYYMDVVLDKKDGIPGMGDTVRVYDSLLNMNLPSRVAQLSYNVLQPELSTMQLSVALYTLSDQLNNSVSGMTSKINYLNTETATVKQEVINAQATANGKNTVFYGSAEPSASDAKENDLWFQYVNGTLSRMYRFDGVQWQMTSSIIPGDAVIGGTIDFANVTALNIDAASITAGILNAIDINGSKITGSTLRTANGSNYVMVDDQFVRLLENDTQKVFLGYYINQNGTIQPTLLIGDNADEHTIPDGTFSFSHSPDYGGIGFLGIRKGFETDGVTNHFAAEIHLGMDGYNTIKADEEIWLDSKKLIRVEGPTGIDILAQDSEGRIYINAGKFITLSCGNTISYYIGSKNVINIDNTGVYLLENTAIDGALTIWDSPGGSNWMELHSDGSTTTNSDHFTWVLGNNQYMRLDEGVGAIVLRSNYTRLVLHDGDATCRIESFNGGPANLVVATVNGSSDRELKKNIVNYEEDALGKINATQIYNYNFKDDPKDTPTRLGIMAQEAPEDVVGQDGKTVDYYSMITLSWKSIQQLTRKITDLENEKNLEIQNLAIKNAELEARIAELEQKMG